MLEKHFKKHLRKDKKLFPCQACGETFDYTFKLNTHKVIHSKKTNIDDRPFSGDTCEEIFKWLSDQNEHVKIHTIQAAGVHVVARNDT